MNILFGRDVHSNNPATYDELVEMMRAEIVDEEMFDHRNRAVQELSLPQRQVGRGLALYLITKQWTQAGHTVAPTSRQELASATLNIVLVLAYENVTTEVGPSGGTSSNRHKKKKRSNRPLEGTKFYTFHQLYGHDTSECRDAPRSSNRSNPCSSKRDHYHEYPHRFTSLNRGRGDKEINHLGGKK